MIPCLVLVHVFNQQLEIVVTAALFHYKISTKKYFSDDVPAHSTPHWICWKNNKKKINDTSYSYALYIHVYPSGLSLSFEASVANEDSPVTSHKNLQ